MDLLCSLRKQPSKLNTRLKITLVTSHFKNGSIQLVSITSKEIFEVEIMVTDDIWNESLQVRLYSIILVISKEKFGAEIMVADNIWNE